MRIVDNISRIIIGTSKKTRIISVASLFLAACAFGAAAVAPVDSPDNSNIAVRDIAEEITLPSLAEQIALLKTDQQYFMREEKVQSSDSLGTLLTRMNIDDAAALAFIKSNDTAKTILKLRSGYLVQAKTDNNGTLYWLSVTDTKDANSFNVLVTRTESGFTASTQSNAVERRLEMRAGHISSSLFAAADLAEIPDTITNKLIDMFSTNIDFNSDLRRGDRFNIIYETFWQNGTYLRSGRILAANFTNADNTYQSIWFDAAGHRQGGYYSVDGKPLKRAFLKSPVEYSRISSGFSMRLHPVTGEWKHHKGIDYAASTGTPVRAAADGFVEQAGRQGAYGNLVVLKHWASYSTAYGHLNRFASNLRKGMKVNQGDIIGYVGATGRTTGPHLHYEFRVNNDARNPTQVETPNVQPLTASELEKFRVVVADMRHRFALMSPGNSEKLAKK